jgi:CRP-like cAMP-binding protein
MSSTNELSLILSAVGRFSEEDVARFEKEAKLREVAKGGELLALGQVSQAVYLVISGAAYQFEYDHEGITENILGLYSPGDWCFNHASFVGQKPSNSIIKAYSDMVVREISVYAIHQLIAVSPVFFQLGGLLQKGMERLRYLETTNSAAEKYQLLFATQPALLQAFPLKMIASYLKIAPETLSRLRAKK